jgi:hypothetical protein
MRGSWSTLIAAACLVIAGCRAGDEVGVADDRTADDLAKWIVTDPPARDSPRWQAANQASREWTVLLQQGRPFVRRQMAADDEAGKLPFTIEQGMAADGLAGRLYAAKVADGWIVAFNAGEFGAGLWWFSPDGKRRYKISQDQVCGFLATERGLLALEGLAHLSINTGQLIQISSGKDGLWKPRRLVDLGNAPQTATQDKDGNLLIVTDERLLRVHPDNRLEILIDKAFWESLHPNSVVIEPSGNINIGMRFGVARLTPGTKWKINWLLPDKAGADAGR